MFADILRKIREAADAFGLAARGELNKTNAVMWQHKMLSFADHLDKPETTRDYPYFAGSSEWEVYDFSQAPSGMIVTRSKHWDEQNKGIGRKASRFGIMTNKSFFADGKGRLVTYPSIHWEGESSSSMNHPVNVEPFRSRDKSSLPKITIDDGQWGKSGPQG